MPSLSEIDNQYSELQAVVGEVSANLVGFRADSSKARSAKVRASLMTAKKLCDTMRKAILALSKAPKGELQGETIDIVVEHVDSEGNEVREIVTIDADPDAEVNAIPMGKRRSRKSHRRDKVAEVSDVVE